MNRLETFVRAHDFPCWCGSTEHMVNCHQLFGRRPFTVLSCAACGTRRLLPRALAEESSAIELYNTYDGLVSTPEEERMAAAVALRRIQSVGFRFAAGQRVLDVGCGDGLLLDTLCREYGCTGLGVDVDERRIARAREQRKHARFVCGLFDPSQVTERYDAIIASAVLEHVLDPVGLLRVLADGLAPGGSLYVLIPNGGSLSFRLLRSWWRELLSIGEHIYLFTPSSLACCAGEAGLVVVAADTDYDPIRPPLRTSSPRATLISLWGFYREAVKRFARLFRNRSNGDLLFARLIVR